MQFTEKLIKSLKTESKRYDVWEKSGRGFGIRVSSKGMKSWIFIYTFQGRKRRMTLGTYPEMSLAIAREEHGNALKILRGARDPGLINKLDKMEARNASTIEGLIDEYIEKWAKPRKRSWKEDKRILYADVNPQWGKRKAKDITKRDVLLLLDGIKDRGAPIAANRTFACIRRMFNFAIERDIIATTPCLTIKAPSKENRNERCLSVTEISDFWNGLDLPDIINLREDGSKNIIHQIKMSAATKLALKFQLATAQRKGEIINAEWHELDLNSRWWTIPADKSKNGTAHRIFLSTLALEILAQIRSLSNDSKWLFPTPLKRSSPTESKPITGASVDHAVRRSIFKGVSRWNPHSLRRTAATHMTAMGISRLTVSKILNHADNSITSIYDRHSYDAEKKHALETWGEKLREIINLGIISTNVVPFKTAS